MSDSFICEEAQCYKNCSDEEEELLTDKVQFLANSIYQEFESLIKNYGEGVVDGLTPLVVNMLETMDKLYSCRDELTVQLDLIKEDQSQLFSQYDREKALRKLAEERTNRIEDQFEETKREFEDRIELLESSCKISETKVKNCRNLITRLEEKESDLRKEYSNLQQRHAELLKTKADHKNKGRSLNNQVTGELTSGSQTPNLTVKSQTTKVSDSVNENHDDIIVYDDFHDFHSDDFTKHIDSECMNSFRQHVDNLNELTLHQEIHQERPEKIPVSISIEESSMALNPTNDFEMRDDNFDSFPSDVNNSNEVEEEEIIVEDDLNDFTMGREIEFLLKENQDLIETKNALNIVKDDLIMRLDEITGELCILQEQLKATKKLKKDYKCHMKELERKLFETTNLLKEKEDRLSELGEDNTLIEFSVDQNGIQTKTKFTRAEVSRILHERNKYKEELLDLQESIRRHEEMKVNNMIAPPKSRPLSHFLNFVSTAASFATEAFIGSGNEMAVAQLNRNLVVSRRSTESNDDDFGAGDNGWNFPVISSKKQITPGSVMRVENPLLTQFNVKSTSPAFDLIPLSSSLNTSTAPTNISTNVFKKYDVASDSV